MENDFDRWWEGFNIKDCGNYYQLAKVAWNAGHTSALQLATGQSAPLFNDCRICQQRYGGCTLDPMMCQTYEISRKAEGKF